MKFQRFTVFLFDKFNWSQNILLLKYIIFFFLYKSASWICNLKYSNKNPLFYMIKLKLKKVDLVITDTPTFQILNEAMKVITKLPNSEQSYKGKAQTHNYINRQNQSTTGKL